MGPLEVRHGLSSATLQLAPRVAVLIAHFPAPGYAAWAVVSSLEDEGATVLRDLACPVLWRGDASPPEGFDMENGCLPLRSSAMGSWGLPVVRPEDILLGLTSEEYAVPGAARATRPPDYRAIDAWPNAAWFADPHAYLVSAARRELSCWMQTSRVSEIDESLRSVWPELQRGYSMLPGCGANELPEPPWQLSGNCGQEGAEDEEVKRHEPSSPSPREVLDVIS